MNSLLSKSSGLNKPPRISVVIPTYNRSGYLSKVLESLKAQELPKENYEVIVIDDGSSDNTEEICQPFINSGEVRYFSQSNQGISAAKNHGVEVARGEIVLFFDDDDVADSRLLMEHLRSHEEWPEETVAVLGYTTWHPSVRQDTLMEYIVGKGSFLFCYGDMKHGEFYGYDRFWGGRTSCKRSLLVHHGLFNPMFTFGSEDIELGYRLSRLGLKVLYNENARSYMIREMGFEAFINRCERQGKSQVWFSQIHPAPEIQKRCMVSNAEATWATLKTGYDMSVQYVYRLMEMEKVLRGKLELDSAYGDELKRTMASLEVLFKQIFISAKYKGIAEELQRQRVVPKDQASQFKITNPVNTDKESGSATAGSRFPASSTKCMAALETIMGIESKNIDELYNKVQTMIENREYEEAKKSFNGILETNPRHAKSLNDLAVLCSMTGDNEKAICLLTELLEVEPKNLIALKNLGKLYTKIGKFEEALRSYFTVLKIKPEDIETYIAVANICLFHQRLEDAKFFLNKVVGISKDTELQKQVLLQLKDIESKELNGESPATIPGAVDSSNISTNGSGPAAAKSILVTSPSFPMFDRAAGSLYLLNILKILRKMNFSITFIAGNSVLHERYQPVLQELGIETYAGDQDAMHHFGYEGSYPKIDYERLFRERKFDIALIDFWYQAEYYLPLIRRYSPSTTIIVDTEDVHFVREMREAAIKGDPELKMRAAATKKRELAIYKKADRLWVVTEEDKRALTQEIPEVPIDVLPLINSLADAKIGFENRQGILFVGNFNHTPNIDAVHFFVKDVLPKVREVIPEVVFYIVGNDPRNVAAQLAEKNVKVTGYVEDLSMYYNMCRVAVAPLRYGAGLKGKIVESLSYGVPVVTTSVGVEGTGLQDGEDIFVSDNPSEMARRIVNLYSDKETWEHLSEKGRRQMQSKWSFDAGRKRLEDILLNQALEPRDIEKKLTSIVILTYNQLEYTRLTIESIRKHTKPPYEIIVVDNASSDGTAGYLKSQRDIRTIFNVKNVGFPAGCNQGMEIAKGDYIVLLNNDVIVTDNWLDGMVECAASDQEIGIVGPMSNWISGFQLEKNITYKKVNQMPAFAASYRRKNRKKWIEVPRIAGFCMLIKREVMNRIGGLDTIFGIGNCEDDDYCLRARLSGFKIVLAGDVFIHHFGSKSFSKKGIENYIAVIQSKESLFRDKWGITPTEWWQEGRSPTKTSDVFMPISSNEPVSASVP
jgi:GT2 family glycosyltransferase/glycosyltransferase involved in cell wall biosynthesis/Flp pilus assembly protein TadD